MKNTNPFPRLFLLTVLLVLALLPSSIIAQEAKNTLNQTVIPQAHGRYKINQLALSPDGKILASGSDYARIRLWNAATGKLVREIDADLGKAAPGEAPAVNALAFLKGGKILASGDSRGAIVFWDIASGNPVKALPPEAAIVSMDVKGSDLLVG